MAIADPAFLFDTRRSPWAGLRPLPLQAVRVEGGFWAAVLERTRQGTLPSQYRLLEETGRLENFRRAAGEHNGPFQGYYFNDSDVYKWLEGAAWSLASGEAAEGLTGQVETVAKLIAAAQQPNGYLNTYFVAERAGQRWSNLRDLHELYCAGHLLQAAVALRRATGNRQLLGVARRLADHIGAVFGPGGRDGVCGHPEIEVALVELYRETGQRAYLEQAQRFIDLRGHGLLGGRAYHLDRLPLRQLEQLEGHAVRALYLCAGTADLVAETGEAELRQSLERLWQAMRCTQSYVNGGLGARHEGEAFGAAYELPNARAYAETCAAIASVMWNARMLAWQGQAKYADCLEWTLYNAVLPGIGLDGRTYFYENPLSDDGQHRRQAWFDCACCPPNLARCLAALPAYFYSLSTRGLWVHMYHQGEVTARLEGEQPERSVRLRVETRYPWDGQVNLEVQFTSTEVQSLSTKIHPASALANDFSLFLRLPAWAQSTQASVNGRAWEGELQPGTYLELRRAWQPGDVVSLDLGMPPVWLESHPHVLENTGRVALARGPLLYCLEGVDQDLPAGVELQDVAVHVAEPPGVQDAPGLLGGVTTLHLRGRLAPPGAEWGAQLYRRLARPGGAEAPESSSIDLTAVPYYAWANRTPGPMQVWMSKD